MFGREVNASLSQAVPLVNIFEADPQGDLMFVENLRDQMRKVNVAPARGGSELGLKITINNSFLSIVVLHWANLARRHISQLYKSISYTGLPESSSSFTLGLLGESKQLNENE